MPFINRASRGRPEQDAAEAAQEPQLGSERAPGRQEPGQAACRPAPASSRPGRGAAATQHPAPAAAPARTRRAARRTRGSEAASARRHPAPDPLACHHSRGSIPSSILSRPGRFAPPKTPKPQRAKLSLMGIEAKVTEREQSGRQVFRVRVGPFEKKEEADRQKEKLETERDRYRPRARPALKWRPGLG